MYAPKLRTWVSDRERRHMAIDFAAAEIMADISKEFVAMRQNEEVIMKPRTHLQDYYSSMAQLTKQQTSGQWMYGIGGLGAAIFGDYWL